MDVPADAGLTNASWLEEVEAARTTLQTKIAEEQEQIRRRIEEEENPPFEEGQDGPRPSHSGGAAEGHARS